MLAGIVETHWHGISSDDQGPLSVPSGEKTHWEAGATEAIILLNAWTSLCVRGGPLLTGHLP